MKINEEKAKKLYKQSPDWFKKELETEFGKKLFKEFNYKDIKTFNDVCIACGTTETGFNQKYENLGLRPDAINYEKIVMIASVINDGWIPDFTNQTQRKYYPYFIISASGFGFSYSDFYYANSFAHVGSRLCFESLEKAEYAGKQFVEIYKGFYL